MSQEENMESTENMDETETIIQNSDVFEEILIMEVRDRRCLWDQGLDVQLRGVDATKRAWDEISALLGQESKILQKKWKNLRDTFRRKHQEMKTYIPSGSAARKKPDLWKFYHLMEFLVPTMQFRKTYSNLDGSQTSSCSNRQISSRFVPITIPSDTSLPSQSQPVETAVVQNMRSVLLSPPASSNSPTNMLERTSPDNSSGLSSPALYTPSDTRKRRSRSISVEPQDAKRMREDEKFEKLLSKMAEPRSEEQVFCSFLQSRLQKLERKYYLARYAYYNERNNEN